MKVNPGNVEFLAKQKKEKNFQLRMYLKWQDRLSEEELDRLVLDIADRIWATMDCTQCGNCCRDTGTLVTQSDIQRMAEGLKLSADVFKFRYLEPLEETEQDDDGDEYKWQIRGKPCPFLQPDNRCRVYEDRPDQCRGYPYLDKPEFSFRTLGMIEKTFVCPVVYQVFEELKTEFPEYKKTPLGEDGVEPDWENFDPDCDLDMLEDEDGLKGMDDLEDVDQEIRINELKEKANELTGGNMTSWSSDEAPPKVQEAFWQNVVDIESGGWTTGRKQLEKAGITLPPPSDLNDEQLSVKLWEVIQSLAEHSTYLYQTNHLSDRELYEQLWHDCLEEEFPEMTILSPTGMYVIDMLGSGSEEDIYLHMKYYADDEERQRWMEEFPMDKMPTREKLPYDRDRLLPKAPNSE